MKPKTVAVVGAAETTELGKIPEMSQIMLHADAALNAMADAGLTAADIDGIATAGESPTNLAHYLGIVPTWVDGTSVGGCSFMLHVRHAAAAINEGWQPPSSSPTARAAAPASGSVGGAWHRAASTASSRCPTAPWADHLFTIPWLRYAKTYGATEVDLANVAVIQREWAALNPRASFRDPLTVDDVLESRMIAWPFTKLMCCLVTDGGGALILTSADRAKDFPNKPVYVLGTGESVETPMVSPRWTTSPPPGPSGSRGSGPSPRRASPRRRRPPDDLRRLRPPAHLRPRRPRVRGRGEAPAFIAERNTAIGGSLPLNTNGGGLSYMHSGMYGMYALQESVRQLRGIAPAQVEGAEISVAHGVGGMFAASGTVVFSNVGP
jgi:acetyl-CoA acetyltransferase